MKAFWRSQSGHLGQLKPGHLAKICPRGCVKEKIFCITTLKHCLYPNKSTKGIVSYLNGRPPPNLVACGRFWETSSACKSQKRWFEKKLASLPTERSKARTVSRHFVRTAIDRRFVRKTFCQDRLRRFVRKTFCQDRLTGGHILGISWAYLWHISGISCAYLVHISGISRA